MIAATTSNNHADLPQPSRQSLAKSHDDGDVKYFFQRPEQDVNQRQTSNSKWSGDDSALEQVILHALKWGDFSHRIIKETVLIFRARRCGMND